MGLQSDALEVEEEHLVGFLSSSDINFNDEKECLKFFYGVVCNAYKLDSYNLAISSLLEAAIKRFDVESAMVLHPISDKICEVLGYSGNNEKFYIGQHVSIREDLCGRILNKNEKHIQLNSLRITGETETMAYNSSCVESYLGTEVNSEYFGRCVLCVISTQTNKNKCFSPEDKALLEKLAEGIACMIDLQKSQAQRKTTDLAAFADGSVKTLDEYLEQARLPEMLGVPARVLEVLENRIGQQPLGISHIAEELNLSKRTLQRRLQQQEVNFAELRDQVRFHYSIDYLIKQHMSIDSISSALDFSDRTSFTNAFKRWTGLSPSTFRKLFRDYV